MRRASLTAITFLLLLTIYAVPIYAQDQQPPTEQPAPEVAPTAVPSPPPYYRLQSEDAMKIAVWGEPNLSIDQTVDPNGHINVPLLGQLYVKGMTQGEVVDAIKQGLLKYLVDPKVTVVIVRFRTYKVHVVGQVAQPGLREFTMGDSVMEAVAKAGSFTELANLGAATLTRKGADKPIPLDLHKLFYKGDMSQNLLLEDGDTLYIPEDTENKFYVLGEVNRPSMYRLKENVTVIDAISQAGGATKRGNLRGTCIIRGGDVRSGERIKVDVDKLLKSGDLSQNVTLLARDVVYVPETSKPNWQEIASIVSAVINTTYLLKIF